MSSSREVYKNKAEKFSALSEKFEKLKWPAAVTGVTVAVQKFAPDQIAGLNFDYIICFLKNTWFEGILLFFIVIFWLFFDEFEQVLLEQFSRFKNKSLFRRLVILSLSIILLIPISYFSYFIFKERYRHFKRINNSYRFYLHEKVCESINNNNYGEAARLCRRIVGQFPDSDNRLAITILPMVEGRKYYSDKYYERIYKSTRDTSKVSREAYYDLTVICSLLPNDRYKHDLARMHKKLVSLSHIPVLFYDKIKSKDFRSASEIFNEYSWFLFEKDISNKLLLANGNLDINSANSLFKSLDKEGFSKIINNSWLIEQVPEILWNNNNVRIDVFSDEEWESYIEKYHNDFLKRKKNSKPPEE